MAGQMPFWQLQGNRRVPEHVAGDIKIEVCEGTDKTPGMAIMSQDAQAALRERVKELTCLYGIAQLAERPGISLDELLQRIVELLPPAWQYPDIAFARIVLDERRYFTAGFHDGGPRQKAVIVVDGEGRGIVEVGYARTNSKLDDGLFLKEEQSLIDEVARQVSLIIERRQAEGEKVKLQEQLRHADRLATIGQLAAGVAHELNEPLGSILGFAQLAKKSPTITEQVRKDIEKIEAASLHAREVIRKLMMFARQMPPSKKRISLNKVVEEGLYFLEARCAKGGVELSLSLAPGLPELIADQAQLNQVLVNLVVNALQAMPDGGTLRVETFAEDGFVVLAVEDTGSGIDQQVRRQIFLPFFTTKDVREGTGLGLAVVHGIVTSHEGSIKVDSEIGQGSRFEVRLPIAGNESPTEE